MKIRLEKPALNNFKAYGWQKWKIWTGVFELKNYIDKWFSNTDFITQIGGRADRFRLLSTSVTQKLQQHLNIFYIHFLNFSEIFQNIFILVSQLWCHKFRKHSFNHILKVCTALLKNQHVLLKARKHVTFFEVLQSFYKASIMKLV